MHRWRWRCGHHRRGRGSAVWRGLSYGLASGGGHKHASMQNQSPICKTSCRCLAARCPRQKLLSSVNLKSCLPKQSCPQRSPNRTATAVRTISLSRTSRCKTPTSRGQRSENFIIVILALSTLPCVQVRTLRILRPQITAGGIFRWACQRLASPNQARRTYFELRILFRTSEQGDKTKLYNPSLKLLGQTGGTYTFCITRAGLRRGIFL